MTLERMVFLGFGKYARADKIYALEPIVGRRSGRRTAHARLGRGRRRAARRVADGADDPARHGSRGRGLGAPRRALDLAERLASAAEEGRVDLGDLGRRARRLLAATARPAEAEQLF